ncbi:MAG: AmmeMemoRadiSam system protein B, partial [Acidimicrobiia bacterium]|nr:AmmeMemoRadiSam system protein B [Acidimicrobiia bacterium]NNC91629.1 AmmeMemoRadiSam system protein B [Acidimicrobiia bacterium]
MFYPQDRTQLSAEVRQHIKLADPPELSFPLRALIVPHAGFIYSGPTAGYAYKLLRHTDFTRVIMLGPSHFVAFSGLALPEATSLATPLGDIEVDEPLAAQLRASPHVHESARAHRREHSLEVQLPFLREVLPGAPVVPLLTGDVEPTIGAELLDGYLTDDTLLVVSSDLSHYHDAGTARRLDLATAETILRRDADALSWDAACGRTGIQIALHLARQREYEVQTLDLRNSADTAGSPDR